MEKKTILIIGATSFLAKSFLQQVSEEVDMTCILTSRNALSREEVFLDLEKAESIQNFSVSAKLDAVIFFQGINPSKSAKDMDYDHFSKMLNVNLIGPTLFLGKIWPQICKSGLVLFFSSVAARKGSYDPSYAASKSGIVGLMYSLANEFPEIRFNAISLGLVEGSPVFEGMTSDFREKHASNMFNKQFVSTRNVNSVILELIKNYNINRTVISIDGGAA